MGLYCIILLIIIAAVGLLLRPLVRGTQIENGHRIGNLIVISGPRPVDIHRYKSELTELEHKLNHFIRQVHPELKPEDYIIRLTLGNIYTSIPIFSRRVDIIIVGKQLIMENLVVSYQTGLSSLIPKIEKEIQSFLTGNGR